MLNTTTHSTPSSQRYTLANRAAEVEQRLPITEEARCGLSNLAVGLIGALVVAAMLLVAHLILS